MITIEKIKSDFSHVEAFVGGSQVYHDTTIFDGHGDFCDVYFESVRKEVKQSQVDALNQFNTDYKKYRQEIEQFIQSGLKSRENADEIQKTTLSFDVLHFPFSALNYDCVLVCGKTYRRFLLFKKYISIRVEFKNGRLQSIERKKDTLLENV